MRLIARISVTSALDMFKAMQKAVERPNVITYNSVITACAKGGKTQEALDMFKAMQNAGEKPDVITYSSVITACANGGMAEKALDMSNRCSRLERGQTSLLSPA